MTGCAADPFRSLELASSNATVEIADTVFFAQEAYQCGPAALATVLVSSGVSITPDELVPQIFIPDRGGSLQTEIVAAARNYGRIPYEIDPDFVALVGQLDASRPVLVLQNLGVSLVPAWHYAVVIGYSAERREVILRSGTTRRLAQDAQTFVRTWRRSNQWGIVLLPADDIPPAVDRKRYLRAVAAAEGAGQLDLALSAYTAATRLWPDEPIARLGLGNIHYARGNLDAAESSYRQMLEIRPGDPVGVNNLASVLLARGLCDDAHDMLGNALDAQDEDSPYRAMLVASEAEVATCRIGR